MRIIASSGMEYIPTWNHNKKEKDPIKIKWRYLTGPEKDRIIGFDPLEFDEKGNQVGRFKFHIDNVELIKTSILDTINLEVTKTVISMARDEETKKATADDICSIPELAGLYTELVNFFMDENRPIDKKKLK